MTRWACFVAELVGTFLLVIIGDGSIAAYVVSRRQVDVAVVCLAYGAGAMMAGLVSLRISGAHVNPAASLALALDGRLRWSLLPAYMLGQYLGGLLAALALYANYSEAIRALDGGARASWPAPRATGHIFATYPAGWLTCAGALLDQALGTAVLLFALSALADRRNLAVERGQQPLYAALIVAFVSFAFSPNCGAAFNPARELSPRLLTHLLGYPAVWAPLGSLYWLVAGLLGPHLGAALGVLAYRLLVAAQLEEPPPRGPQGPAPECRLPAAGHYKSSLVPLTGAGQLTLRHYQRRLSGAPAGLQTRSPTHGAQ